MGKLFSTTWSYFTKVDEKLAECKLCRKMVKTSGNTTNARNHLKVKHKLTDDEIGPTSSKKGHPEGPRYPKTEEKEVEILEQIPINQKEEPMDEHYELQQSETEDKEEIYCLEMLEEDEEISEDSPQFEPKQPTIVLKRSSEETKRSHRLSSPQHSSDSAPSAPRYDFSSAVDIFFASMAATVKQMPPEKVVLIKQKIATIVFQEELQQLRSEGYQYVQE